MPTALLGPLGYMHLESAEQERLRSLAIGTNAVAVIEEFDDLVSEAAPVLLYSSHEQPVSRAATWTGTWGGWAEAEGGGIPPRKWALRYRSALMREEDKVGGVFQAFYLVENLKRLPAAVALTGLRASKGYLSPAFIPEGPIIVEW